MIQELALSNQKYINISNTFKSILKGNSRISPLTQRLKSKTGRSNGRIVCPRRGHFNKRIYRFIDFKRIIFPNERGVVLLTEHDPIRSAYIALICYPVGLFTYILKPSKLEIGDSIINQSNKPNHVGDSSTLRKFSSGVLIHNIDSKIARSAGCSAILIRKDKNQALLKLKSGELRFFNLSTIASLGYVSNENHFLRNIRKAGTVRYLGKRPRTRPSSMNPVDHPMGGRTRGGKQPTNKKGIINTSRPTKKQYRSSILYTKRQLKLLKQ
uniref:Ribosomal protein L2 n=1 Tax=Didymium iridis TaxID=5793 RepID=D3X9W7_9MYCE|nr:ribosomal protein L2 [Didymium iridis]ADD25158.1 ribosomal protein L2 [Didymium iridis]